jgi:hypothetical protein
VLLVLALLPVSVAVAAPKTDVVVFANGDRLTGEVKGFDRGELSFETDAAGTLSIEWARLVSVESKQILQVELTSGMRYTGQSVAATAPGRLRVAAQDGGEAREFAFTDVVRMDPIDQGSLIARLDGYVTAGYDYTKANELQTFTFTGGLSFRNEHVLRSLDGSTSITSQETADDSSRYDVTANNRIFLPNRQFYQGFLALQGNDELGLDLRTTLGGAYGYYLVQNSRQEWAVMAGLGALREDFATRDRADSIEGLLGTQYAFFRFADPEANLDASLYVLPSLTESGRIRSELKIRSRYEIITDLFFEISLYGATTRADEETDEKSDYGVTTSLGYSF